MSPDVGDISDEAGEDDIFGYNGAIGKKRVVGDETSGVKTDVEKSARLKKKIEDANKRAKGVTIQLKNRTTQKRRTMLTRATPPKARIEGRSYEEQERERLKAS